MRISTLQIFDAGSRNILSSQSTLYKTQNQLGSGRRILTPQDDPVGASQVLLDTQAKEVNLQYADNQKNASLQLALEEDRIKSVVESIQYIKEQVVAGNISTYTDEQRKFFAGELQSQLDFLVGMANSADASGHYLFSGYQGETQPFQNINGEITYYGDEGQRLLQVGASRQIAVSDSGHAVFERNLTGNGVFAMGAASTNTGTGVIGVGSVTNPTAWAAAATSYSLTFDGAGNYTINGGAPIPYTSGQAIQISGVSFSIQGTPVLGDTFTVAPSTTQSMFTTIQNLITAFDTPITANPAATAQFQNSISEGMLNLDKILDNAARVNASIGERRKELAGLVDVSANLDLNYADKISKLQDLDYAEAISRFMSQQMQLEAAQSSFSKISNLSLFNYL